MKNLNNILEGLLDTDFDINIEPIIPKFKNQDTAMSFAKYLGRINSIVTSYHAYIRSIQALEKIKSELNELQFSDQACMRLLDGIDGILKSHTPAQIKQKDYDLALNDLNGIRPAVVAAEELEKILIKMHQPKNVVMRPEHPDNDLWALRLYQQKYISGVNWIDDNLNVLKTEIKKIRNVEEIEYLPQRHSILITIKK